MKEICYSFRSASMGSMVAARRPGMNAATSAMSKKAITTPATDSASCFDCVAITVAINFLAARAARIYLMKDPPQIGYKALRLIGRLHDQAHSRDELNRHLRRYL